MRFVTVIALLSSISSNTVSEEQLERMYSIKTLPHIKEEIAEDPKSKSFIAFGENPKFAPRFGNRAIYGNGNKKYPRLSITGLHQGNNYAPSSQNSGSQNSVSQYGPSFGSSASQQPYSANQNSPGITSSSSYSSGSYNSGVSSSSTFGSSISTNLNMIESMLEYHFSISNLVQYSVDEILNYGCWCQLENPDLHQYQKGPPVDNVDRKCQNRKRCHKCIKMGRRNFTSNCVQ